MHRSPPSSAISTSITLLFIFVGFFCLSPSNHVHAVNLGFERPVASCFPVNTSASMVYVWGQTFDVKKCDKFHEYTVRPDCYSLSWQLPNTRAEMWRAFDASSSPGRMDQRFVSLYVGLSSQMLQECGNALYSTLVEAHQRRKSVYALLAVSDAAMSEIDMIPLVHFWNQNCSSGDPAAKFDGVSINNEYFSKYINALERDTGCSQVSHPGMLNFLDMLYEAKLACRSLPLHFSLGWSWNRCNSSDIMLTWGPPGMPRTTMLPLHHMIDIIDSFDLQASETLPAEVFARSVAVVQYASQKQPPKNAFINFYLNPTYDDCTTTFFSANATCTSLGFQETESHLWSVVSEVKTQLPQAAPCLHFYKGVFDTDLPGWPKSAATIAEDVARPAQCASLPASTPFIAFETPSLVDGNSVLFGSSSPGIILVLLLKNGVWNSYPDLLSAPNFGFHADLADYLPSATQVSIILYPLTASVVVETTYVDLPLASSLSHATMKLDHFLEFSAPIPQINTTQNLYGTATPGSQVVAAVRVDGKWFSKPFPNFSFLVSPDGQWEVDFTLTSFDVRVTAVAVMLYPPSAPSASFATFRGESEFVPPVGVLSKVLNRVPYVDFVDPAPMRGQAGDLHGIATPTHRVAIYVNLEGMWHSRPSPSNPSVLVGPDGTFTVALSQEDQAATAIAAHVYLPSEDADAVAIASGQADLPSSASVVAAAVMDRTEHLAAVGVRRAEGVVVLAATPGYQVALVILVGQEWYSKPFAGVALDVPASGKVEYSYNRHPGDLSSTRMKAFLIPPGAAVIQANGGVQEPSGGAIELLIDFSDPNLDLLEFVAPFPLYNTTDPLFVKCTIGNTLALYKKNGGLWYSAPPLIVTGAASSEPVACDPPCNKRAIAHGFATLDFVQNSYDRTATDLAVYLIPAGVDVDNLPVLTGGELPTLAELGAVDFKRSLRVPTIKLEEVVVGETTVVKGTATPGRILFFTAKVEGSWIKLNTVVAPQSTFEYELPGAPEWETLKVFLEASPDALPKLELPLAEPTGSYSVTVDRSHPFVTVLEPAPRIGTHDVVFGSAPVGFVANAVVKTNGLWYSVPFSAAVTRVSTKAIPCDSSTNLCQQSLQATGSFELPFTQYQVNSGAKDLAVLLYPMSISPAVIDGEPQLPSLELLGAVAIKRIVRRPFFELRFPAPKFDTDAHLLGFASADYQIVVVVQLDGLWFTKPMIGEALVVPADGVVDIDFITFPVDRRASTLKIFVHDPQANSDDFVAANGLSEEPQSDAFTVLFTRTLVYLRASVLTDTTIEGEAPAHYTVQAYILAEEQWQSVASAAVTKTSSRLSKCSEYPQECLSTSVVVGAFSLDVDSAAAQALLLLLFAPGVTPLTLAPTTVRPTLESAGALRELFIELTPSVAVRLPLPSTTVAQPLLLDATPRANIVGFIKVGGSWYAKPTTRAVMPVPLTGRVEFDFARFELDRRAEAFLLLLYHSDVEVAEISASVEASRGAAPLFVLSFNRVAEYVEVVSPLPRLGTSDPLTGLAPPGYSVSVAVRVETLWYTAAGASAVVDTLKVIRRTPTAVEHDSFGAFSVHFADTAANQNSPDLAVYLYPPGVSPALINAVVALPSPASLGATDVVTVTRAAPYLRIVPPPHAIPSHEVVVEATPGYLVAVVVRLRGKWFSRRAVGYLRNVVPVRSTAAFVYDFGSNDTAIDASADALKVILYAPETADGAILDVAGLVTEPIAPNAISSLYLDRGTAYVRFLTPLPLIGEAEHMVYAQAAPGHTVSLVGFLDTSWFTFGDPITVTNITLLPRPGLDSKEQEAVGLLSFDFVSVFAHNADATVLVLYLFAPGVTPTVLDDVAVLPTAAQVGALSAVRLDRAPVLDVTSVPPLSSSGGLLTGYGTPGFMLSFIVQDAERLWYSKPAMGATITIPVSGNWSVSLAELGVAVGSVALKLFLHAPETPHEEIMAANGVSSEPVGSLLSVLTDWSTLVLDIGLPLPLLGTDDHLLGHATVGFKVGVIVLREDGRWGTLPGLHTVNHVSTVQCELSDCPSSAFAIGTYEIDFTSTNPANGAATAIAVYLFPPETVAVQTLSGLAAAPDAVAWSNALLRSVIHRAPFFRVTAPVPLIGTDRNITGTATGGYKLVTLIRVDGLWYPKPDVGSTYAIPVSGDVVLDFTVTQFDVLATAIKVLMFAPHVEDSQIATFSAGSDVEPTGGLYSLMFDREAEYVRFLAPIPLIGSKQFLWGEATIGYQVMLLVRVSQRWYSVRETATVVEPKTNPSACAGLGLAGCASSAEVVGLWRLNYTRIASNALATQIAACLFEPLTVLPTVTSAATLPSLQDLGAVSMQLLDRTPYLRVHAPLPLIKDTVCSGEATPGFRVVLTSRIDGLWYYFGVTTVSPSGQFKFSDIGVSDAIKLFLYHPSSDIPRVHRVAKEPMGSLVTVWIDRVPFVRFFKVPSLRTAQHLTGRALLGTLLHVVVQVGGAWYSVLPSALVNTLDVIKRPCVLAICETVEWDVSGKFDIDFAANVANQGAPRIAVFVYPSDVTPPVIDAAHSLPTAEELGALTVVELDRTASLSLRSPLPRPGSADPIYGRATPGGRVSVALLTPGGSWYAKPRLGYTLPVGADGHFRYDFASNDGDTQAIAFKLFLYAGDAASPNQANGVPTEPADPAGLMSVLLDRRPTQLSLSAPLPEFGDRSGLLLGRATVGHVLMLLFQHDGIWRLAPDTLVVEDFLEQECTDASCLHNSSVVGTFSWAYGGIEVTDVIPRVTHLAAASEAIAVAMFRPGAPLPTSLELTSVLPTEKALGALNITSFYRRPFLDITVAPRLGTADNLVGLGTPRSQVAIVVKVGQLWHSKPSAGATQVVSETGSFDFDFTTLAWDKDAAVVKAFLYPKDASEADVLSVSSQAEEPEGGLFSLLLDRSTPFIRAVLPLPRLGSPDHLLGEATPGWKVVWVLQGVDGLWYGGEVVPTRPQSKACNETHCTATSYIVGKFDIDFTSPPSNMDAPVLLGFLVPHDAVVSLIEGASSQPTLASVGAVDMFTLHRTPNILVGSPLPVLGETGHVHGIAAAAHVIVAAALVNGLWYSRSPVTVPVSGVLDLDWAVTSAGDHASAAAIKLVVYPADAPESEYVNVDGAAVEPVTEHFSVKFNRNEHYLKLSRPFPAIDTTEPLLGEATPGLVVGVLVKVAGYWWSSVSATVVNATTLLCERAECTSAAEVRGTFALDFTQVVTNKAATELAVLLLPAGSVMPTVTSADAMPSLESLGAIETVTVKRTAFIDILEPVSLFGTSDPILLRATPSYRLVATIQVGGLWFTKPYIGYSFLSEIEVTTLAFATHPSDALATALKLFLYRPLTPETQFVTANGQPEEPSSREALVSVKLDRTFMRIVDPIPLPETDMPLLVDASFGFELTLLAKVAGRWQSLAATADVSLHVADTTVACESEIACSAVSSRWRFALSDALGGQDASDLAVLVVPLGDPPPVVVGGVLPSAHLVSILPRTLALRILPPVPLIGSAAELMVEATPGAKVSAVIEVGGLWYSKPYPGAFETVNVTGSLAYTLISNALWDPQATKIKLFVYPGSTADSEIIKANSDSTEPTGALSVLLDRATVYLRVENPIPPPGPGALLVEASLGFVVAVLYQNNIDGKWSLDIGPAITSVSHVDCERPEGCTSDVSAVGSVSFVFSSFEAQQASTLSILLFSSDIVLPIVTAAAARPTMASLGAEREFPIERSLHVTVRKPFPSSGHASLQFQATPGRRYALHLLQNSVWLPFPSPAIHTVLPTGVVIVEGVREHPALITLYRPESTATTALEGGSSTLPVIDGEYTVYFDRVPRLLITQPYPALGTTDHLYGEATVGDTIAVYVRVSGSWYAVLPVTELSEATTRAITPSDGVSSTMRAVGAFDVDFTRHSANQHASDIAVFLLPAGVTPPVVNGLPSLPTPDSVGAIAFVELHRHPFVAVLAPLPLIDTRMPLRVQATAGHQLVVTIKVGTAWWSKPEIRSPIPVPAHEFDLDYITNQVWDPTASIIKLFLYPSSAPTTEMVVATGGTDEPTSASAAFVFVLTRTSPLLRLSLPVPLRGESAVLYGNACFGHTIVAYALVDARWHRVEHSVVVSDFTMQACEDDPAKCNEVVGQFSIDVAKQNPSFVSAEAIALFSFPPKTPAVAESEDVLPGPLSELPSAASIGAVSSIILPRYPLLTLASPPKFGSNENIRGLATPGYSIAAIVRVGAVWYSKPSLGFTVNVLASGQFELDFTVLPSDEQASQIALFLFAPNTQASDVIRANGARDLPTSSVAAKTLLLDRVRPVLTLVDLAPLGQAGSFSGRSTPLHTVVVCALHDSGIWDVIEVVTPSDLAYTSEEAAEGAASAERVLSSWTVALPASAVELALYLFAPGVAVAFHATADLPTASAIGAVSMTTVSRALRLECASAVPNVHSPGSVELEATPGFLVYVVRQQSGLWHSWPSVGHALLVPLEGRVVVDVDADNTELRAFLCPTGAYVGADGSLRPPAGAGCVASLDIPRFPIVNIQEPFPALGSTTPLVAHVTPGTRAALYVRVEGVWYTQPGTQLVSEAITLRSPCEHVWQAAPVLLEVCGQVVSSVTFANINPLATELVVALYDADASVTILDASRDFPTLFALGALGQTKIVREEYIALTSPVPLVGDTAAFRGVATPGFKVSMAIKVGGEWYSKPVAGSTIEIPVTGVFTYNYVTNERWDPTASLIKFFLHAINDTDVVIANGDTEEPIGGVYSLIFDRATPYLTIDNPVPAAGTTNPLLGLATMGHRVQVAGRVDGLWASLPHIVTVTEATTRKVNCAPNTVCRASAEVFGIFRFELGDLTNATELAVFVYPPTGSITPINSLSTLPLFSELGALEPPQTSVTTISRELFIRVAAPVPTLGSAGPLNLEATPGYRVGVAIKRVDGRWYSRPRRNFLLSVPVHGFVSVYFDTEAGDQQATVLKAFLFPPSGSQGLAEDSWDEEPSVAATLATATLRRTPYLNIAEPYPHHGSSDPLVVDATPGYRVAVLAKVGGVWWSKPGFQTTLVVPPSGKLAANFVTHPVWDPTATELIAYLYDPDVEPSQVVATAGDFDVPPSPVEPIASPVRLVRSAEYQFYVAFGLPADDQPPIVEAE